MTLLSSSQTLTTATIPTSLFGFEKAGRITDGLLLDHSRDLGGFVALQAVGRKARGRLGSGTIVNVALRVAERDDQDSIAYRLRSEYNIRPTRSTDCVYYRSITFREPGGLLLQIATKAPASPSTNPQMNSGAL